MMKVILYGSPFCSSCLQLKNEFILKQIDFEYINVFEDEVSKQKLLDNNYTAIPVVEIIKDDVVLFFNIVDFNTKIKVFDILLGDN